MGCCGGNTGTTGTSGGISRWIIPVLIAAVLAILLWSALSGRERSLSGTEAPAPTTATDGK